jgi:heptosyltransferase-2
MGGMNRRRDRYLKRLLEFTLRPFLGRPKVDLATILESRPQRILLVRQHNQMGDMLCATPALRALRETFPEARILLLTAPINDGVVRNNPDVDAILLFDKREVRSSLRAAWRFLRELRDFGADTAFVLNTVSFSSTSAWMAVLSGARFIVGGSSQPFGWSFSEWLYSLETPVEPEVRGHAIDHGLKPLEAIGIVATDRRPILVPGPGAEAAADSFLARVGVAPWAAVHPGAGKQRNRWAPARFATAIRFLEDQGASVFLVEGPADAEAVESTLAALSTSPPVLRGVDLGTVAAVIGKSHVVLVNDTGVMHVAGAMGTPGVAMFGPTPSASWGPRDVELSAFQSPDGSMDGILPEMVLPLLGQKLERGRVLRPLS